MKLSLSTAAERDLRTTFDYLYERSPTAAHRTVASVLKVLQKLERHPELGRRGPAGTRELVIVGTPYVAIYEIGVNVMVLRIFHGAQDRSRRDEEQI